MNSTIHTALGFSSLISGLIALLAVKGSMIHKVFGRVYIASMLGLNITAFGIYTLFGKFAIYHWFAVISIVMTLLAVAPLILKHKTKEWKVYHYYFVNWSYVGLLCATSNEMFVHVPVFTQLAKQIQWLPLLILAIIILTASIVIPNRAKPTLKKVEPVVAHNSE